jgi:hypothetical protein
MSERYRPANGTEGDYFIAEWCMHCQRYRAGQCGILIKTLAYNITDPAYPGEWVQTRGEPRCTAYEPKRKRVPKPAKGQLSLL